MIRSVSQRGSFLPVGVVLVFALFGFARQAEAQISVSASLSGNNEGPVQGFAYAQTQYAFGHIDEMHMQISGPDGSVYWDYGCTATGSTGCPGSVDHSLSVGFQYDSDYFLNVYACSSDDNGSSCSSDQAHFRTPPQGGGTEFPPGTGCSFYFAPCPTITSIEPQPIHLGTGTFTVHGTGLDVLTWGQIWYKNPWLADFHWPVTLVSASYDQATYSYDFNPTGELEPCWNYQQCGGFSLHVYGQDGDNYWLPIQVLP